MTTVTTSGIREVLNAMHYSPSVSVIFTLNPVMGIKKETGHYLKTIADKVEKKLRAHNNAELANTVLEKFKGVINNLQLNTRKKSIAIYVSPVFEKVLYLDVAVKEKLVIDSSFEIRDIVYNMKQVHRYMVLLLDINESRIYLGNTDTFVRMDIKTSLSASAYENDPPQRVANFSDPQEHREVIMNKLLRHIDDALTSLLETYALPLFVFGPSKITGHFKSITKHRAAIVEYIEGDYDDATPEKLHSMMQPYIADWDLVKQKQILQALSEASGRKKVSSGIAGIWPEARSKKGKLLIVEKNYAMPNPDPEEKLVEIMPGRPDNFPQGTDPVDDIIEEVLGNGGDVEFVDDGVLAGYDHIALILHY